MNGRGDASDAAETKLGASDETAVSPAAIHLPRPANIANCGTHDRRALPRASKIEASTDRAMPSHSSQPTISSARIATGAIFGGCQITLEERPDLVGRADGRERVGSVESDA